MGLRRLRGCAAASGEWRVPVNRTDLAAAAAGVAVAVTVPFGGRPFAIAVTFAAGVVLLVLSTFVDRAGPRPVVAGAAIAAVGAPLRLVIDLRGGLGVVPALVCAMLLATFLLLILTGGRKSLVDAVGATLLVGTLVGLGAGSLVLLRNGERGFRWALAAVALPVAAELAGSVARRVRPDVAAAPLTGAVVAVASVTGALLMAANPPFTVVVALIVGALGCAAVAGARALLPALAGEDAAPATVIAAVAVLILTPVTLLLATTVQS